MPTANDLFDAPGEFLVDDGDFVDGVGDLAVDAGPVVRQAGAEIAVAHPDQGLQQHRLPALPVAEAPICAQIVRAPALRAAAVRAPFGTCGFLRHSGAPVEIGGRLNGPRLSIASASSFDTAALK